MGQDRLCVSALNGIGVDIITDMVFSGGGFITTAIHMQIKCVSTMTTQFKLANTYIT